MHPLNLISIGMMNARLKPHNDRDSEQFKTHLNEIKDIIEPNSKEQ